MILIGIGNKARNGKDTAAEAIKNYYDKQTRDRKLKVKSYNGTSVGIFKYATALYQECADFIGQFGSPQECFGNIQRGYKLPIPVKFDVVAKENKTTFTYQNAIDIPKWVTMGDPTPAPMAPHGKHPKLLQWWGTEFRRTHFDQDYWVKKCFDSIPANLDIAIISDVRFPNEADAIKQRGGFTVNVQRLREDGTQYFSEDRPADHPSEIALDDHNWDFRIVSKDPVWTGEVAITLAEYLKGQLN